MGSEVTRRGVLVGSAAASVAWVASTGEPTRASDAELLAMPLPPMNHRYLLSCKLSMIAKGENLPLVERLQMAREAGFDGVDLDEAGGLTPTGVRESVWQSRVFVHNAINHAHWKQRFTIGPGQAWQSF